MKPWPCQNVRTTENAEDNTDNTDNTPKQRVYHGRGARLSADGTLPTHVESDLLPQVAAPLLHFEGFTVGTINLFKEVEVAGGPQSRFPQTSLTPS